ncbi:anti-sigma factor family protein [Streptomyces alboflavus]|uniref:anti-sigma factor family protein n=1 Tax=Streptomyces alboflavus TaxID=67267 RepID=UPI000D13BA58|nr:zf-HC2 domain-containing protein [Streptomyces alboflavus]
MKKLRFPGPRQLWADCCERVRHLRLRGSLEAYADGELTGARRAQLAAHVARCWVCSGSLQTLRLVKASLRTSPRRHPQSLGAVRILRYAEQMAAVHHPQGAHRTGRRPRRRRSDEATS